MTREEAFRAGFENPLIGASAPLQRLYGTVTALGEELGGADMGTPVGTRFRERQAATKAEVKRLQKLREQFPEEFGRGQMMSQEQADPYMLGLGTMPFGMRPGVAAGPRELAGPGGRPMLAGPGMLEGEIMPPPAGYLGAPPPAGPRGLPPPAPPSPYYRSVPPEMGTSMRPMTPFQQNQVGMATGRYGTAGYAPEMSVTDFETYGPMGARPTPGPYAPSGFDRNMLEAFRAGRANYGRNVRPAPMGGGFTLEELGQAVTPYRQGGLTYEPVGMAPQGGSNQGYGGGMDFGVTREGMATQPSAGMRIDPLVAALAGGAGYYAGSRREEQGALPEFRPNIPEYPYRRTMYEDLLSRIVPEQRVPVSNALQGEIGADILRPAEKSAQTLPPIERKVKKRTAQEPSAPTAAAQTQFEPNLNYYVTQALDRLLGQREAERGREQQMRMQGQGYY